MLCSDGKTIQHNMPDQYWRRFGTMHNNWVTENILFIISMVFSIIKARAQVGSFIPHSAPELANYAQVIVAIFYAFFYLLALGLLNIKRVPYWWVYLGAMSYPLYLLHNRSGKTLIDFFSSSYDVNFVMVSVIIGLLFVSLLVHLFVEKPINWLIKKLQFEFRSKQS